MTDKNSEEDAGIDEDYGEPKEKVHLAGVALRKPYFFQQAKGRGSGYSLHTPCPYTQELLYPCVKVCQRSQPDQYGLHFQEVPKHPGEMLALDKVNRPCKTAEV